MKSHLFTYEFIHFLVEEKATRQLFITISFRATRNLSLYTLHVVLSPHLVSYIRASVLDTELLKSREPRNTSLNEYFLDSGDTVMLREEVSGEREE